MSFDPPEQWTDVSITTFQAPGAAPAASIMVSREPMKAATLATHASAKIVELAQIGVQVDLVHSEDMVVGGRRATALRFRYATGGSDFEQTMILVEPGDDPERMVTIFSTADRVSGAAKTRPALLDLVRTVQFASPAPAELNATPSRPSAAPKASSTLPEPPPMVPMPGLRDH